MVELVLPKNSRVQKGRHHAAPAGKAILDDDERRVVDQGERDCPVGVGFDERANAVGLDRPPQRCGSPRIGDRESGSLGTWPLRPVPTGLRPGRAHVRP